jgi:NMD protein affecting ribosome stability and mRNA decay
MTDKVYTDSHIDKYGEICPVCGNKHINGISKVCRACTLKEILKHKELDGE